jgi:hypothetical protein
MALALVAANEVSAAAERMRIMGFPIKASGKLIGDAVWRCQHEPCLTVGSENTPTVPDLQRDIGADAATAKHIWEVRSVR